MSSHPDAPTFAVISGRDVHSVVFSDLEEILCVVRDTYIAHGNGDTVNPDSYFLRFPARPNNRIIALPAHVTASQGRAITGIKWIASFPGNIEHGLPRASAVIVLNDSETGYPLACIEGSIISAARTAASAVLAANALNGGSREAHSIGVVGCGLIARYIMQFLVADGWSFDELHVHDRVGIYAEKFLERFCQTRNIRAQGHASAAMVVERSNMVMFTTTASTPYVHDRDAFRHNPLVLHISLRDIDPGLILSAHNVVDDIDHCLKANTSVHLAEQATGRRDFLGFTLPRILAGEDAPPDRSKPVIFSPFGLGALDIAVAQKVFDKLSGTPGRLEIRDFFHDTHRV